MPTSHSYISQRLRLHYCDWGNPDKPSLLLVHGMQDHCRTWDWFVEAFADEYHIIAPDLRGHGDSSWSVGSSYSHLDYVYDLTQLIRQCELAPLTLVGHSLGGALACLYAGTYPDTVQRLVSIEGIGLWQRDEELSAADTVGGWINSTHALSAREPRRYESLDTACARMQTMNPNLTPEQAFHLTVHGSNQNEDGSWSWKFDNYTHNWSPYGLPQDTTKVLWKNIACPTLLMNADNGFDHRTGQNGTLRYFSNATVQTVTNAGHWTYHDQLDEVTGLVRKFFATHPL